MLPSIKDMPLEQIDEELKNWAQQDIISQKMFSELRCSLFEHFNKTRLGREINLQDKLKQELIISPLELVLAALVAEYLYAKNYHFTLSLLLSESTSGALPNFERNDNFRFRKTELSEILDAIGLKDTALKPTVAKCYLHGQSGQSLLHCFFKSTIASLKRPEAPTNAKEPHEQLQTLTNEVKNLQGHLEVLMQNVGEWRGQQPTENEQEKAHFVVLQSLMANLENLLRSFEKNVQNNKPEEPEKKKVRFTEWVLEMSASEMGKKYLKKLQVLVIRLIHKEKKKLKRKYKLRHSHKKQQSPPALAKRSVLTKTQSTETASDLNDLWSLQKQSLDIIVAKKLETLTKEESSLKVKLTKMDEKLQKYEEKIQQFTDFVQQKKEKRSDRRSILTKSVPEAIPDAENVIKNIRTRINSLEAESEQLYKSFKTYLDKKNQAKDDLQHQKIKAWQQFQEHQTILQKYEKPALPKIIVVVSPPPQTCDDPVMNFSSSTDSKKSSPRDYKNPFHEINLEEILKIKHRNDEMARANVVDVEKQATNAVRKHLDELLKPLTDTANQIPTKNGYRNENLQEKFDRLIHSKKVVNGEDKENSREITNGNGAGDMKNLKNYHEAFRKLLNGNAGERKMSAVKSSADEKRQEKEYETEEVNQINLNETYRKEPDQVISDFAPKPESPDSGRAGAESSNNAEIAELPIKHKHTEVMVKVVEKLDEPAESKASTPSASADKVLVSTGNVSSVASDDFWD